MSSSLRFSLPGPRAIGSASRAIAAALLLGLLWGPALAGATQPPPAPAPSQPVPAPAPSEAAPAAELPLCGEERNGTIDSGDPVASGRHYEDCRLPLAAGEVVQIDMEAAAADGDLRPIDSAIEIRFLHPPAMLARNPNFSLARNDDLSETSTNARLFFAAPDAVEFVVRAQGRRAEPDRAGETAGMTGPYVLRVSRMTNTAEAEPLVGGRIRQSLGEHTPVTGRLSRVYRYRPFWFNGLKHERIRIDMASADFDSRLELVGPDGRVLVVDDDSGGERDARIFAILPQAGRFIVRAQALIGQSGRFTLGIRRVELSAPGPTRVFRPGEPTISGELTEGSPAIVEDDGAAISYLYQIYRVRLPADQATTFLLHSDAFDTYLEVGADSILGFAIAQQDDDGGEGFDSRLVVRPERGGEVVVRARSLGFDLGAFTLRILPGDVERPSDAGDDD